MMELTRVLVVLPLFWGMVYSCSPEGYVDPTMPSLVHFSDVVLTGSVVRTFPDSRWDSAYTIEVKVSCLYKKTKSDVPPLVNITEAGSVPGMCHSSDFQIGNDYIIFTRENEDEGEITLIVNEAQRNMTEEEMGDLSTVCGVELVKIKQGENDPKCPPPVEENCQKFDPETHVPPPPPGSPNPAGVSGKDAGSVVTSSVIVLILSFIMSV